MSWTTYQIVWRLLTPMHIGWGKIGNLQRTRPYVTGRTLWGALAHRLGRDAYRQNPDMAAFARIGEQLHNTITYTYFYPTLIIGTEYKVQWPWENSDRFALHLLRSYASTALVYPQRAADESTLHEIEFLSPQTLEPDSQPVYLMGYFFVHSEAPTGWQVALSQLQLGGERSYGWGSVTPTLIEQVPPEHYLFGLTGVMVDGNGSRPQIVLPDTAFVLSHTRYRGLQARGQLEPLVGREWPVNENGHAGQHVVFEDVCFAPGSVVTMNTRVIVQPYGIWEAV